jgi:hypothetical protein
MAQVTPFEGSGSLAEINERLIDHYILNNRFKMHERIAIASCSE